jgi:hypothetical protein
MTRLDSAAALARLRATVGAYFDGIDPVAFVAAIRDGEPGEGVQGQGRARRGQNEPKSTIGQSGPLPESEPWHEHEGE